LKKAVGATLALAAAVGLLGGRSLALHAIDAHQTVLAPLLARAGLRCRLVPSCSQYAEVVVARDGLMAGGWKSVKRISRCGPWTAAGTRDDP
jgi:hypothetical protein